MYVKNVEKSAKRKVLAVFLISAVAVLMIAPILANVTALADAHPEVAVAQPSTYTLRAEHMRHNGSPNWRGWEYTIQETMRFIVPDEEIFAIFVTPWDEERNRLADADDMLAFFPGEVASIKLNDHVDINFSEPQTQGMDIVVQLVNDNTDEVIMGDVNGDGEIDIADALEILKHLAGISTLTGDALAAALITDPTATEPTIADALEILKYLAGIPGKLNLSELEIQPHLLSSITFRTGDMERISASVWKYTPPEPIRFTIPTDQDIHDVEGYCIDRGEFRLFSPGATIAIGSEGITIAFWNPPPVVSDRTVLVFA
jgi:hypothetical protein